MDGVCDPLSFPLPPSQCAALIAVAQRAPFGRGSETVVDVAVRNTWQLDCSAVHVDSAFLETIRRLVVPRVCGELGVSLSAASVDARLYKLLVYETGGFFRAHRDTEKEDGMFGTLVVLLPVQYTGGELVVTRGTTRPADGFEEGGVHMHSRAVELPGVAHRHVHHGLRAATKRGTLRHGDQSGALGRREGEGERIAHAVPRR